MQIASIHIERQTPGCQCGTLAFRSGARSGMLLWVTEWRRGQKVTVEFVPGEGATQADIRAHHDRLVDELVKAMVERVSRKLLFS